MIIVRFLIIAFLSDILKGKKDNILPPPPPFPKFELEGLEKGKQFEEKKQRGSERLEELRIQKEDERSIKIEERKRQRELGKEKRREEKERRILAVQEKKEEKAESAPEPEQKLPTDKKEGDA